MGKHWCFTLNNYTQAEQIHLSTLINNDQVNYLIYGREVGDNNTPHLQGFISFSLRKRLNNVKDLIGARCHLEAARGTPAQNREYCSKDGDFDEYGTLPSPQGKRSDWDSYVEYVQSLGRVPTQLEMARDFPALYARYATAMRTIAQANLDPVSLVPADTVLREWQEELSDELDSEPDDREIKFLIDHEGNTGKTFFCRYLISRRDDVQVLRVGKRDDLAYAIDETKRVFIFDIPRTQMEFLQYPVLEMLKDQMVFSAKYHSVMKTLGQTPHVVVFGNEHPDLNKMSMDRFNIKEI